MREKGQNEVAKTLETPVFSRGIEILTEKNQLQKQCNTISCVSQGISSIYSIFLLLKMALLKKTHQKAQDLQKFGRHLLYIGRTDMVRDSPAGLHALFVP